jgi:hypothetical protein
MTDVSRPTTVVRSWAICILLLDSCVEPVRAITNGALSEYEFPAREASAVLERYGRLKARLNAIGDAARAEARRTEVQS